MTRLRPRRARWAIGLSAGLVLCAGAIVGQRACGRPRGQVIAWVGPAEITLQDLQAEARAQGRSTSPPLAPDLLQAVIARTLLAQEAVRRRIPDLPGSPSDRRRAEAQSLVADLLRRIPAPPPPTSAQIDAYVAAHPEQFAERRRLQLEELRYSSANAPDLQGLPLAEARAALDARAIPHRDTQSTVDEAALPLALRHGLAAAPEGEVVTVRDGDRTTAVVQVSATAAPLTGAEAQSAAQVALSDAARRQQVHALIDALRARQPVRLQAGYGA